LITVKLFWKKHSIWFTYRG